MAIPKATIDKHQIALDKCTHLPHDQCVPEHSSHRIMIILAFPGVPDSTRICTFVAHLAVSLIITQHCGERELVWQLPCCRCVGSRGNQSVRSSHPVLHALLLLGFQSSHDILSFNRHSCSSSSSSWVPERATNIRPRHRQNDKRASERTRHFVL